MFEKEYIERKKNSYKPSWIAYGHQLKVGGLT